MPLGKLNTFKELLEKNGYHMCTRRYLFDLIPFILSEEIAQIITEISGKFLGVAFDGTTHTCEALTVVVRFVSDSWVIH